MPDTSTINDQRTEIDLAHDRGLHYGDGLFETIAVLSGRPRWPDRHFDRLQTGCERLGLDMPSRDVLLNELEELGGTQERVVAKLLLTRGDGGRGYAPPESGDPRRLWQLRDWPDVAAKDYSKGVEVVWLESVVTRHPVLGGLKHLGRLENVLAARELATLGAREGLLRDGAGQVIEAVSANVFAARDGKLLTPTVDEAGVAGVMRAVVLDTAASLGIETKVATLRRADFARADEVFLTSAVRGIVPVATLGRVRYGPGDMARQLSEALAGEGLTACG